MKTKILLSIGRQKNKQALLPAITQLPQDEVILYGTEKTAKFLTKHDINNQLVHKISQSNRSPNIADLLIKNQLDLIINIPTRTDHQAQDKEYTDGQYIRRKAVENNITLITDVEVAKLYLSSLSSGRLSDSSYPSQSPPAEPFTAYYQPLYNIDKSYDFNYEFGPFFDGVLPEFKPPKKPVKLLGLKLNSRFGVPAGPLLNSRWVKTYADLGYDLLTYKTIRTINHPCHKPPNVVFIDEQKDYNFDPKKPAYTKNKDSNNFTDSTYPRISITNSFGVPSKEPDVWQEDIKQLLPQLHPGQLLILSVMGTAQSHSSEKEFINDFVACSVMGQEAGVKAIEVNLSCPNLGGEALFADADLSTAILKQVRQTLDSSTRLLAKLGYFPRQQQLKKFINSTHQYLEGYTAINTVPKKVVDTNGKQALPGESRVSSGTCGALIKEAGLSTVAGLADHRQQKDLDYVIIGVGGVMTPNDYQTYLEAGADAVQAATGPMWNPYLAYQIKQKY